MQSVFASEQKGPVIQRQCHARPHENIADLRRTLDKPGRSFPIPLQAAKPECTGKPQPAPGILHHGHERGIPGRHFHCLPPETVRLFVMFVQAGGGHQENIPAGGLVDVIDILP